MISNIRFPFRLFVAFNPLFYLANVEAALKLSVAGLDILFILHILFKQRADEVALTAEDDFDSWVHWWISVIEGIAEAGKTSKFGVSCSRSMTCPKV